MDPNQAIASFLGQGALKRGPKRLLAAVSGGADSVALLCACAEAGPGLGWGVAALHCDHGLRGRASDRDAAFVETLCGRLKVPLFPFEAALKAGPGLEERARNWRRACYGKAAQAFDARLVLLGHHARDQAETVLLNLVRGCGPAGATGMQALTPLAGPDSGAFGGSDGGAPEGPAPGSPRVLLGRPFLALDPDALRLWLAARGQAWREDASNKDPSLARNRIRLKVLPELQKVNLQAVAHLGRFARSLTPVKEPKALSDLLRLDQGARARAGEALAKGQGRADLGRGWSLELSSGRARVLAPESCQALGLGHSAWREWRFDLKLAVPTARKLNETEAFWFSTALLGAGPRVRPLKSGDKLKPFGFEGRRKAFDLLREAGVPGWAREGWPGLEAEGRLLALPQVRRGTGFPASAGRKALRLTWEHAGVDKLQLQ